MNCRSRQIIGTSLVATFLVVALLATLWTPYDPIGIDLAARLQPPSRIHWFGTDEFGRDVLSRVMAGASASVVIAVTTVAIAISFGTVAGLICGYFGGAIDRIGMMINDALLAFPGVLLALAVLVVLGAGRSAIVLALGVAYIPSTVRVVRGAALSVREREFVEVSQMMGNSAVHTIVRHVLPNCLAPLIILATGMLGWALLAESSLSFLGLGVAPPAPTWGNMLASSRPYMQRAAWLEIAPGLCIALTLLGMNLLGDALRDHLDPRLRSI